MNTNSGAAGVIRELQARLAAALSLVQEASGRQVITLKSNLRFELRGEDGALKEVREIHNLITTVGKRKLLDSTAGAKYLKDYAYIAIGTGTTAAAAGDTALQTESARALATVSNPNSDTLRVEYTFPAGTGTGAVTESAMDYQNTASGNILARQVFSAINKGASDTLKVTWDLTM